MIQFCNCLLIDLSIVPIIKEKEFPETMFTINSKNLRNIVLVFTILVLNIVSFGQSETGRASMEGVVTDQNGAIVLGASIVIKNTETGLERTLVTNSNGRFVSSTLPVGRYTITVKADGFAERTTAITLTVGETGTIEIMLSTVGAEEIVTVTGGQELIDVEESAAGSSLSQRAIEDLPVRGRNYSEFVQLSPGVVQEGDRSGLVIAGQRSINSNVAIDGADFNDSLQGNQRGGNEAVFFFPQTAIREFQVVRAGATAEVGRTNAGFVNAVTKSGGNQFRGEIFYFNRNARLTSPDAFGNDGENNQNLLGGSVGGPIVKDRAFFFFGIEQNYLKIPIFVQFRPPTGVTLPAEIQALQGEMIGSNDPTSLFGRVDINLNRNNTIDFQYTHSNFRGDNFSALDEGVTLTDRVNDIYRTGKSHGFKTSLVSVLSPNVVNELRGQIATDNRLEESNFAGPEIRIDDIGLPGSSNARFGGNGSRPRMFETTRYQLSNNLSWNVGEHRLKFGFDANINRFNAQRVPDIAGVYRFQAAGGASSIDNYNNNIARRLDQTLILEPGREIATGYQKEFALFIQDKVKITRNLTLSAGLRWEGLDNPTPPYPNPEYAFTQSIPDDFKQWQPRLGVSWDITGRGNSVLRVSSGIYTARTPSVLFMRPFVENGMSHRTIRVDERSGGNCRFSPTATNCLLRPNPDGTTGSNFVVAYPMLLSPSDIGLAQASRQRIFGFDPDFKNPRSFQVSATWEHKFAEDFVFSAGFLRNSTWNLQRRLNRNLLPPIPETHPDYPVEYIGSGYPVFLPFPLNVIDNRVAWISINESTAHSDYNAMTMSLRRRFAKRMTFSANYTFSRTRDDDSNERNFSQEPTLNPYDLSEMAAYSKQDVRHNLNISGIFDLGKGFTLSSIMMTRSGFPYTAVFGDDYNGDGNADNDRAIVDDKLVPRNSFRQPSFYNLDMRLLKAFNMGENMKLAFSAEVFNVFSTKNKGFGADAISVFCTSNASNAGPNPNGYNITCPAGLLPSKDAGVAFTAPSTARFGGPRQLQLGVRFSF